MTIMAIQQQPKAAAVFLILPISARGNHAKSCVKTRNLNSTLGVCRSLKFAAVPPHPPPNSDSVLKSGILQGHVSFIPAMPSTRSDDKEAQGQLPLVCIQS